MITHAVHYVQFNKIYFKKMEDRQVVIGFQLESSYIAREEETFEGRMCHASEHIY